MKGRWSAPPDIGFTNCNCGVSDILGTYLGMQPLSMYMVFNLLPVTHFNPSESMVLT